MIRKRLEKIESDMEEVNRSLATFEEELSSPRLTVNPDYKAKSERKKLEQKRQEALKKQEALTRDWEMEAARLPE